MKSYKKISHTLGNDESGKRAWLNPKEEQTVKIEEKTAADLNSQFENTGIKYELVEEEVKEPIAANDLIPESEKKTEPADKLTKEDLIPDSEKVIEPVVEPEAKEQAAPPTKKTKTNK